MISAPALLRLAKWYQDRRQQKHQGGLSCDPEQALSPPRRNKSNGHPAARQLWGTVPAEHQERILGALIRVIALQLAKTPEVEGVTRDRS